MIPRSYLNSGLKTIPWALEGLLKISLQDFPLQSIFEAFNSNLITNKYLLSLTLNRGWGQFKKHPSSLQHNDKKIRTACYQWRETLQRTKSNQERGSGMTLFRRHLSNDSQMGVWRWERSNWTDGPAEGTVGGGEDPGSSRS